jgi:hypothetical protein
VALLAHGYAGSKETLFRYGVCVLQRGPSWAWSVAANTY